MIFVLTCAIFSAFFAYKSEETGKKDQLTTQPLHENNYAFQNQTFYITNTPEETKAALCFSNPI